MEQPESNPRFCTNNCGFYGSSQFDGMCSKCYREHTTRSYNAGQSDNFPSYFSSSNNRVMPSSSICSNDVSDKCDVENEIIGQMDEDSPANVNDVQTTVQEDIDTLSTSPFPHAASAPILPVISSENIDIPTPNDSNDASTTLESSSLEANSINVEKKKRNRCSWETCNKKLGLTGFQCRCGGLYCSIHRYTDEHKCTFDYKEHGQNEIRKNMPVVQADRVRRI